MISLKQPMGYKMRFLIKLIDNAVERFSRMFMYSSIYGDHYVFVGNILTVMDIHWFSVNTAST